MKQGIVIAEEPNPFEPDVEGSTKRNIIRTEVYYSKGGVSYATYNTEPRGYYLSVAPVGVEQRNGYSMESFGIFGPALKRHLVEAKAYSPKRLAAVAEDCKTGALAGAVAEVRTKVLERVRQETERRAQARAAFAAVR